MDEYEALGDQIISEELGITVKSKTPKVKPIKPIKEEDNNIYTSYYENEEYILEQIEVATPATHATYTPRNKNYKYIRYSKLSGTFEEVDYFKEGEREIRPITSKLLEKGTIKLPTGCTEYGETSVLIKEIKDYLYQYFEPPKFYQNFLPFYVLFTWVYQAFPVIAYLHFCGLTGTGKTVAAETLSSICYKPTDAAGSVTIASIFRIADKWKGTLFLDEFDLSSFGKEAYTAVLTFLKTGVSDRALLRVEGDKLKEVEAFTVKAPKIFTSERPVIDAGLQSRMFVIKMEKNRKRLPLYKLDGYYTKANELRNKLLLWRFRNLNKIDLQGIEYGFPELECFDRRVQQILSPIYLLSDEGTKKELVEFAREQEEETLRERRESLEGQIFQSLVESQNRTLSEIYEKVNKGKTLGIVSDKKIANIIRKVLGFGIERVGHENISTVVVNEERESELAKYFGVVRTPVARVADVANAENAEQVAIAQDIFETTP